MKLLLLCLLFVVGGHAAKVVFLAKLGERQEIGGEGPVRTWERSRDDGVNEYVKYCEPGDKAAHCSKFVTMDGKVGKPETKATVSKAGVLILEKVQKHDAAMYTSPDSKPRPHMAPNAYVLKIA